MSKEIIYDYIKNNTNKIKKTFSGEELALKLNYRRNTISSDLNRLYNEGYLIKN